MVTFLTIATCVMVTTLALVLVSAEPQKIAVRSERSNGRVRSRR